MADALQRRGLRSMLRLMEGDDDDADDNDGDNEDDNNNDDDDDGPGHAHGHGDDDDDNVEEEDVISQQTVCQSKSPWTQRTRQRSQPLRCARRLPRSGPSAPVAVLQP